jgi:ribosomal protein S18 acetylase RimI-like enzyme
MGAATLLLKEVLAQADQSGVPVFLQTARDGSARRLYEKLGFEKTDEYIVDFQKYGGEQIDGWGYISMAKEPKAT